MKPLKRWTILTILITAGVRASAGNESDVILGVWNTTDNKSKVAIYTADGKFAAKIIELKEPNWPSNDGQGMGGKPKSDRNNPDPKLRDRPIVGLEFMSGFTATAKHRWENGTIYDPENGKTYKAKMTLVSTNQLEVRGFIGISVIGRTVVWTR